MLGLRWSCIAILTFGVSFGVTHLARQTGWYKDRLYRKLLTGDEEKRLQAASMLATLGGERQLLEALKAEKPEVSEMARRGLEHIWFNAAGSEACRMVDSAHASAEKEEFKEALRILDEVTKKYPNYAEGFNQRASVFWQTGDFALSRRDCERTLALNPNHYGAWQGLGICQLESGEITEACQSLRLALKIAPHDDDTRKSLLKCEALLRTYSPGNQKSRHVELL